MSELWKTLLPIVGSFGSVVATALIGVWVSRRLNKANAGKAVAEGEVAYSKDALEWRKQAMDEVGKAKTAADAAEEKADAAEEKAEQCAKELRRLHAAIDGCQAGLVCPVSTELARAGAAGQTPPV